jgi:transaldolase
VVAGRPAQPVREIPAVRQRLPAISACLAEGISINVTLIFSLARYGEVIEAFLTGLERARAAGRDLAGIASVASLFVSRVDTEVDRRLDKLGTDRAAALRGRAAIANARLAYQRYEQAASTSRWKSLEEAGARPQRPLWASTGVKDPAYHDTRYVTGLVAPGVVNTMPEATLNAVSDHGDVPDDSIRGTYDQSRAVLGELASLGIDYDDVVQVLEDQGVSAFDASWEHLGQRLASALGTGPGASAQLHPPCGPARGPRPPPSRQAAPGDAGLAPGSSRAVRWATHRLGSANGSSRSAVTGARIWASAPCISPRCRAHTTS